MITFGGFTLNENTSNIHWIDNTGAERISSSWMIDVKGINISERRRYRFFLFPWTEYGGEWIVCLDDGTETSVRNGEGVRQQAYDFKSRAGVCRFNVSRARIGGLMADMLFGKE
jgi:hypothetical protein